MKITMIARGVCVAAMFLAMGLSNAQAGSPASYMYILMVNMIGPAANSLWKTAGTETLGDQEWERLKQMAARLNESAEAVSSGGTTVADIERAQSGEWKTWARKFTDAVSVTVNAAERRDRMGLIDAGNSLMEVCEGCHAAFPQAVR